MAMANVKEVVIRGEIPFHCGEQDKKMIKLLGQLNMPSFGLRISYGGTRYVPNEYPGGKTCLYTYTIEGREAVTVGWLVDAVDTLRRIGTTRSAEFRDVENCMDWEKL
jgi:hypothetical protein